MTPHVRSSVEAGAQTLESDHTPSREKGASFASGGSSERANDPREAWGPRGDTQSRPPEAFGLCTATGVTGAAGTARMPQPEPPPCAVCPDPRSIGICNLVGIATVKGFHCNRLISAHMNTHQRQTAETRGSTSSERQGRNAHTATGRDRPGRQDVWLKQR